MVAMQWRSNSESGAVTFLEFLEQRGQYGGSIDLPAVLLAPAVCGHCGKLEDLRRDWNTYSHNRESAPKNHELTVPESDVDGSLADRIAQIAFEENTCFMCAKTILEATQWIDGDDHCCNTPLHYAARSGNLRMLFHLIYQLGHLYGHEWTVLVLRKLNVHGETALHEAIRLGRSKCMVGMLMWVDPDLALHPGVGTSPLYLAVSLGHKHIAEMLHSTSGGNLSYSGPDGQNALHAAVYRPYGMVQMLLDWNKDLSKDKDKNGSTPLHHVASEQSEDYINIWYGLEKHATWHVLDANPYAAYDKDKNGLLPLHIAALMDRKVPIRILLKMCRGCIALRDSKKGRSFLHIAVANKALNVVRYACQEPAFAPILNARDNDGNTALHLAVKVEVLAMFCRLLQNPKVLLNVRNNKEQTPLDLARSKTRTSFSYGLNPEISIYRTLIDAGARHGSFWRDSIQNQLSNLEDVENQSKQVVGTDHMEKEKKAEQKDSDVFDAGRTIERAAYTKHVPLSIVTQDVHKPNKYLIRPLTPACPDQYPDARPTEESNRRKKELMAKSSWPEVVGWPQLNAADQINIDRPDVTDVGFYKQGSPLPSGYNPKRVVIISDDNGVVLKTPVIG
ncbi:hypothetical protein ZWY2020_016132 [Hordeum vulgare]|nr:hypothetical protein ZWY2020_016132 [Hordeum vulgare]